MRALTLLHYSTWVARADYWESEVFYTFVSSSCVATPSSRFRIVEFKRTVSNHTARGTKLHPIKLQEELHSGPQPAQRDVQGLTWTCAWGLQHALLNNQRWLRAVPAANDYKTAASTTSRARFGSASGCL